MTSFSSKLRNLRWHHWLLVAFVVMYALFIGLSYLYLPGKLKQVLETDVSHLIGRVIAVERVDVNPFAISINVGRFSIADRPERPLVGWQRLFVNVGFWKSIFKWEIALDEFLIDAPEINIEKHPDRFNFTDILDRFGAKGTPEETSTTPPAKRKQIALEIFRTAINQGMFRFTDLSGTSPAQFHLGDITIGFKELYFATGDEHLNTFDLHAMIPGGGDVQLTGQYRIHPLHVDAEVVANHVQLSTFSGFVENILPMKVGDGSLSFTTRILAKQENELKLRLEQGRFQVTDLALDDDIVSPALLRAESILAGDVVLDFLDKHITVGSVTLDGITANQWLDTAGRFRYEPLIKRVPTQTAPPPSEPPTQTQPVSDEPWRILVKQIGLKNSTILFSDQNKDITVDHALSEITLDLENLTLTSNEKMSMQFSSLLDGQGRIGVDGALTLSPFSMDLTYRLEKLQLPLFSEYIESNTFLRLDKGNLGADGRVTLGGKEGTSLIAALDLIVEDFRLTDTRTGDALFSFGAFKLNDIHFDPGSRKVSIASLGFVKPEVFTEMSKEKKINLATLKKSGKDEIRAAEADDKKTDPDGDADWIFSIGKMMLQDGIAYYTDKSVAPIFKTALHDLTLTVNRLSTDNTGATPFSLAGSIDRYAPFAMKGTLAPLDKPPGFAFSSSLSGLEMPSLSPFATVFIGNNLKSGKLSLTLDYSVKNRKLKGKNTIVAENLYLGEKVPGEPVVKAPVALGLALLRDARGVIDLDVRVAGDLDDPGFNVSGIVVKALVNILVKAAASPFKLLGALAGGREDIGKIDFVEGLAGLSQDNREGLEQLSKALTQRPQLALRIKGNAGDKDDGPALKALRVKKLVATARKMNPDALQSKTGEAAWWTLPDNRDALGNINDALNLPPVSERAAKLRAKNPALKDEALMAEVYRHLYKDVTNAQKIETAELVSLADRRALSIKQYLVDVLKLDHQRVSVTKTQQSELTGRVIALEINAM